MLTAFKPTVHLSIAYWNGQFQGAPVDVQRDPERSMHGKKPDSRGIQIGISRTLIDESVSEWIIEIRDPTQATDNIRSLRRSGHYG